MLKIFICDDNAAQLAEIKAAAQQYFSSRPLEQAEITVFDSSLLFLDSLDKTGGCDIALLDICMPEILGTGVAKEIRRRRDKTEIIFLTTSDEYAVDAFALKAAHYLIKPFTQVQFHDAMDRAMAAFSLRTSRHIVIRSENGAVHKIELDDILYLESCGHTVTVYSKELTLSESRHPLSQWQQELEILSPGQFITPYKGFLVNQQAIQSIEREQIIVHGGDKIPIPKRGFRKLKNVYFDYMFGGGDGK